MLMILNRLGLNEICWRHPAQTLRTTSPPVTIRRRMRQSPTGQSRMSSVLVAAADFMGLMWMTDVMFQKMMDVMLPEMIHVMYQEMTGMMFQEMMDAMFQDTMHLMLQEMMDMMLQELLKMRHR